MAGAGGKWNRHDHVDGISPKRFRSQTELALTEKGLAQAAALAERIISDWHPVAIYTSPLQRCVATGEAIAAATRAPCQVLKSLIDLNYGASDRGGSDGDLGHLAQIR